MEAERWKKVGAVMEAALDVHGADRDRFLEVECDGEQSLLEEVRELLEAADAAGSFLGGNDLERMMVRCDATDEPEAFGDDGRYRVIRQLGAGGMGVVYEVEDRERQRRLALKTIPSGVLRADPERLFRLKREFRAVADIAHPNLIRLHELVVREDESFFTMELVEGVDLVEYCIGCASGAKEGAAGLAVSGVSDCLERHAAGARISKYSSIPVSVPESACPVDTATGLERAPYTGTLPPAAPVVSAGAISGSASRSVVAGAGAVNRAAAQCGAGQAAPRQAGQGRASRSRGKGRAPRAGSIKAAAARGTSLSRGGIGGFFGRLESVLVQLASALDALHQRGIVHRDVKPSNILVTKQGRVVLLDFGAISLQDGQHGGWSEQDRLVGTAAYMSPEQVLNPCSVSSASDWYAVGVMLYRILSGRLPFLCRFPDVLSVKRRRRPVALSAIGVSVPDWLERLCLGLLERDPGLRAGTHDVFSMLGSGRGARRSVRRPGAPTAGGTLVGRCRELEALETCLGSDQTFETGAVGCVLGDSGIGKTALVSTWLQKLRDRHENLVVLAGRCDPAEHVRLGPVDEIVDQLSCYWRSLPAEQASAILPSRSASLGDLFPVLDRVEQVAMASCEDLDCQDAEPDAPVIALRETLECIARRGPLVVLVDDVQWADPEALRLLGQIWCKPTPLPALLLLVGRRPPSIPATDGGAIGELLERAVQLELGQLEKDEAGRFAESILGGAPRLAEQIAAESDGHPAFIEDLAHWARTHSWTDARECPGGLMEERLRRLPALTRTVLAWLCASPEPVDDGLVARSLGLPLDRIERELRLLAWARLVRRSVRLPGALLEPYHPLVRHAMLELVSRDHASSVRSAAGRPDGVPRARRSVAHARHCSTATRPRVRFAAARCLAQAPESARGGWVSSATD